MVSVASLDFRFDLLRAISGDVLLYDVTVRRPDIRQLLVDRGALVYRNLPNKIDMQFDFSSGASEVDDRLAPLNISGKGRYVGNALQLDCRIESPLKLHGPGRPYHLDIRARAGATRSTASGGLVGPLALRDFNLAFGLSGPNLALLYPFIGVVTPDTPPYHLQRRLSGKGATGHYDDFSGKVGDSDLVGSASVDPSGARPFLRADMRASGCCPMKTSSWKSCAIEMGILDPTKVTRTALQNAASITDLMITTEAMVAEAPRKDEPMGGGHGGGGMGGMDFQAPVGAADQTFVS